MNKQKPPSGLAHEKWRYLQMLRSKEIDRPDALPIYREFVEYLDQNCSRPTHYIRYCQTFLAMTPWLEHLPGTTLLETGGICSISTFLMSKGFQGRQTTSDLRYEIDAEDLSVDLVLSLEVIEHVKDQNEEILSRNVLFNGTGIVRYAAEMHRVLKPGGLLVLTTPNPCSARALELLVSHASPMVFRQHEREYARAELEQLFAQFELLAATTHYSFFHLGRKAQAKWNRIFSVNKWDASNRGDDHFMVFRKPMIQSSPGEPSAHLNMNA